MLKRIDDFEKYEYHRFLDEAGETRFPKISFVLDLYDTENYKG
jgi:hypothetical protein